MMSFDVIENDEEYAMSDEELEDTPAILAEMEALQAIFDVDFNAGPRDRALALARQALDLKQTPSSTEGRLTVVALSHCLGAPREDLVSIPPVSEGSWAHRTFEALAFGWMRWLTLSDTEVLRTVANMHPEEDGDEDDGAAETLCLNFWARAIELLAQGQPEEAKRFFERATEVGSQFGTRTNPSICWSYAASFFPRG
jgi:tetratricopeptide (TPR) repeat protein